MTKPEDFVAKLIQEGQDQGNESEKTISLQLIGVATFVATVLGAFVVIPGLKPLGLPEKIFLLIDILFLFSSIGFGIIHLLVTKAVFNKAASQAILTSKVLKSLKASDDQEKWNIVAIINTAIIGTMAFFYLQLATLSISVTIFLGIIISLLF